VDTALNIALEAIDRLKVTASSHQRAFLVEVMGRECGYLALMASIAGGAEAVIIPEAETDPEIVAAELRAAYERGKSHALVVVAEGAPYNAARLARFFQECSGAAHLAPSTGCWPPGWARQPPSTWLRASTGY
jgi:6-phosphofructokinase 1